MQRTDTADRKEIHCLAPVLTLLRDVSDVEGNCATRLILPTQTGSAADISLPQRLIDFHEKGKVDLLFFFVFCLSTG